MNSSIITATAARTHRDDLVREASAERVARRARRSHHSTRGRAVWDWFATAQI